MNEILLYIGKSTLCMSILYGVFHVLLGKEDFFKLNRRLLITIIIFSGLIPLTYMPKIYNPDISVEVKEEVPEITVSRVVNTGIPSVVETQLDDYTSEIESIDVTETEEDNSSYNISLMDIVGTLYLLGLIFSLILSIVGISKTVSLIRRSSKIKKNGYSLLVLDKAISAFSFGRYIVISKTDYENNKEEILTHEEAHVRHMHSLDLLFLEVVRIIYWFNPLVYLITRNLKEIHEYQADKYTINNGIDAMNYQRLIIKKCVGHEQFALANSFNYCQIKKRIAMINKKQTSRVWKWKAAAIVPVACMLLMSFSNTIEKSEEINSVVKNTEKQWTESDFKKVPSDFYKEVKNYRMIFIGVDDEHGTSIHPKYSSKTFPESKMETILARAIDYELADEKSRVLFNSVKVNGKKMMVSNCVFIVNRDKKADYKDYQRALNIVGNKINNIRNKYANKLFNAEFSELKGDDQKAIERLIPMEVYVQDEPIAINIVKYRPNHWTPTHFKGVNDEAFKNVKDFNRISIDVDDEYGVTACSGYKGEGSYHRMDISNDRLIHQIKIAIDFGYANSESEKIFKTKTINGKKLMVSSYAIELRVDPKADKVRCQQVYDVVGETIMKARDKYSKKLFNKLFAELDGDDRLSIEKLIPFRVFYQEKELTYESSKQKEGSNLADSKSVNEIAKNNTKTSKVPTLDEMYKRMADTSMVVRVNKYGFIAYDGNLFNLKDDFLEKTMYKYRDYSRANNKTKKLFKPAIIDGKSLMVCDAEVLILINKSSKSETKSKAISRKIKSIFNEMNESFSQKIYGKKYSTLNGSEKHEISNITNFKIATEEMIKG